MEEDKSCNWQKTPLPPPHKKSNGPSIRYLLHYSKMGFIPKWNEFHAAFTCKIIWIIKTSSKNKYLRPFSMLHSLLKRIYRYECRTAFTLHRYKRSSRISVSFWNENLNKLIHKWLVSNNFTLVSCDNRDELVLEQNSFRYHVKGHKEFLFPEHHAFFPARTL